MTDLPPDIAPEPSPAFGDQPRRPPALLGAAVALVLLLVGGSVAFVAARDDTEATSVASLGASAEPITRDNADIQLAMDADATDEQIAGVREFAEASLEIAAYTFVSSENLLVEFRAVIACTTGSAFPHFSPELPSAFRFRVTNLEAAEVLMRALVALPGVAQVAARSDERSIVSGSPPESGSGAATTSLPSTTVALTVVPAPPVDSKAAGLTPTTLAAEQPATTIPVTSTAPPEAPRATEPVSKEIAFVAPEATDCTTPPSFGLTIPATPMRPPTAVLPPAGDQPSDVDAARDAVVAMWLREHDGSIPLEERMLLTEDHEELWPLVQQAKVGKEATISQMHAEIFDVVFVSPTRAAVEWRNVFTSGGTDMRQVGYAVLIDGQWLLARETHCAALARGGAHCPEGP